MATPPVGGTGYINGKPAASMVDPGSFDLGTGQTPPVSPGNGAPVNPYTPEGDLIPGLTYKSGPLPKKTPIMTSGNTRNSINDSHSYFSNVTQPQPLVYTPPKPDKGQQVSDTYDNEYNSTLGSFDQLAKNLDMASQGLLGKISMTYSQRRADQAAKDKAYQHGLEVLGIKSGTSQYAPQQQLGLMNEAERSANQNLMKIDAEEQKAIIDANNAKAEGDMKIFNERVSLIKDLRKQKADALKDLYDQSLQPLERMSKEADALKNYGGYIFEATKALQGDAKAKALQDIADHFGVDFRTVASVASDYALGRRNTESLIAARNDSGGGSSKSLFTDTQVNKALSDISSAVPAGLGLTPDDFAKLNYSEQNGFVNNPDTAAAILGIFDGLKTKKAVNDKVAEMQRDAKYSIALKDILYKIGQEKLASTKKSGY